MLLWYLNGVTDKIPEIGFKNINCIKLVNQVVKIIFKDNKLTFVIWIKIFDIFFYLCSIFFWFDFKIYFRKRCETDIIIFLWKTFCSFGVLSS